jgi:DNA-binding transcriptional MerR regulator
MEKRMRKAAAASTARRRFDGNRMKYLTTLEVAHQLSVSKQTLLNWLYAGKIPEPPRNKKGYRLWSPSRVSLVRKLILEGRLHKRTVVHREPSNRPDVVNEYAREVNQFLRDGKVDVDAFLKELSRLNVDVAHRVQPRKNSHSGGRGSKTA